MAAVRTQHFMAQLGFASTAPVDQPAPTQTSAISTSQTTWEALSAYGLESTTALEYESSVLGEPIAGA